MRYGLREPAGDIVELYQKTRATGFGAEVRRRLMIGTYVLSAGYYDAYYVRAQKIRTLIKRDFERAFADGVDAILTPATPSAAFGIGEKGAENPVEMLDRCDIQPGEFDMFVAQSIGGQIDRHQYPCLLYTSPSPRDS